MQRAVIYWLEGRRNRKAEAEEGKEKQNQEQQRTKFRENFW